MEPEHILAQVLAQAPSYRRAVTMIEMLGFRDELVLMLRVAHALGEEDGIKRSAKALNLNI